MKNNTNLCSIDFIKGCDIISNKFSFDFDNLNVMEIKETNKNIIIDFWYSFIDTKKMARNQKFRSSFELILGKK